MMIQFNTAKNEEIEAKLNSLCEENQRLLIDVEDLKNKVVELNSEAAERQTEIGAQQTLINYQ